METLCAYAAIHAALISCRLSVGLPQSSTLMPSQVESLDASKVFTVWKISAPLETFVVVKATSTSTLAAVALIATSDGSTPTWPARVSAVAVALKVVMSPAACMRKVTTDAIVTFCDACGCSVASPGRVLAEGVESDEPISSARSVRHCCRFCGVS